MTQDDLLYNGNLKALLILMPVSKLPRNEKFYFFCFVSMLYFSVIYAKNPQKSAFCDLTKGHNSSLMPFPWKSVCFFLFSVK